MIRHPNSRLSLLFELYAAATAARSLVAAAMAGSPLSPEDFAIYSILFDEGPHAPTELARRSGMPPTSMSHVVRAMLERGHVERATNADDRRSYRIVLTPAGLAAHAAASGCFAEADERFTEALESGDEAARAVLLAIGRAAATAEARLQAEQIDTTA